MHLSNNPSLFILFLLNIFTIKTSILNAVFDNAFYDEVILNPHDLPNSCLIKLARQFSKKKTSNNICIRHITVYPDFQQHQFYSLSSVFITPVDEFNRYSDKVEHPGLLSLHFNTDQTKIVRGEMTTSSMYSVVSREENSPSTQLKMRTLKDKSNLKFLCFKMSFLTP